MRGFYLKYDLNEENLVQTFNITGKNINGNTAYRNQNIRNRVCMLKIMYIFIHSFNSVR